MAPSTADATLGSFRRRQKRRSKLRCHGMGAAFGNVTTSQSAVSDAGAGGAGDGAEGSGAGDGAEGGGAGDGAEGGSSSSRRSNCCPRMTAFAKRRSRSFITDRRRRFCCTRDGFFVSDVCLSCRRRRGDLCRRAGLLHKLAYVCISPLCYVGLKKKAALAGPSRARVRGVGTIDAPFQ